MEYQQLPKLINYPKLPKVPSNIKINNHYYDKPNYEEYKSWKLKPILPQCYAALAIALINFSIHGFLFFIINFELTRRKEADLREYELPVTLVGCIVGGIVAHISGARFVMILTGVVITTIWTSSFWFHGVEILKWASHISIFIASMMQGPCYVYLAEISQPMIRSSIMATVYLSSVIGSRFNFYILYSEDLFFTSKGLPWINIIFPVIGIIIMFFLPESPYWLANQKHYDRVESSLLWFRRGINPAHVKSESTEIIQSAQNSSPLSIKLFGQKPFYIPFLIVCFVFLINASLQFQLLINISFYPSRIQEILRNIPINAFLTFTDMSLVLPAVVFVGVAALFSQRILILISLFSASIALLVASTLGFFYEKDVLSKEINFSLLLTFKTLAILLFNVGIVQGPFILNGELFPLRVRNLKAGIALAIFYTLFRLAKLLTEHYFTTECGFFLTLGSISMIGFLTLFCLFPENKNKNLVEIEQSSSSITDLRRKKTKDL